MSTLPPAVAPSRRLTWPDAAKAVCILLVVVYHVATKDLATIDGMRDTRASHLWTEVTVVLTPLRMPLFFLISGFFASRALDRSWGQVTRPRIANFYYLFVLWLVIDIGFRSIFGNISESDASGLGDFLLALVTAYTGLWYFFALALYFAICKVARPLPVPLMVAALIALSLVSDLQLVPERGNTDHLLENFLFFYLGTVAVAAIRTFAERPRWATWILAGGGFLLVTAVFRYADLGRLEQTGQLPLRILAVIAGVATAVIAAAVLPAGTAWVARLGRQTLPIYAMHALLLLVAHSLFSAWLGEHVGASEIAALLYVPVMVAALTAICLGLQSLLLRLHADWLFAMPAGRVSRSQEDDLAPGGVR